jgi:mannose-1-phosphate guanylyltransferase
VKEARFRGYVKAAFKAAAGGHLMVLGIQPRWPETGYGYIEFRKGFALGDLSPQPVKSFREKPDAKTAKKFVAAGNFFWNAGMFFWSASRFNELLRRHQPKTATLLAGLPHVSSRHFAAKLAAAYPLCENISVDYAIIEKAHGVSGIALDDIGWNDVGSWEAMYALAKKDAQGNASASSLVVENATGNYVDAKKTVALVGVNNLVIVDTPDALLIASREHSQNVSKLVKTLDAQKREELL